MSDAPFLDTEDLPPDPLPPEAMAELRRALVRLRGGNPLARAAGLAARAAATVTGPMLRLGLRTTGRNAAALAPTLEAALTRAFDVAILGLDGERPMTALTPNRARLAAALSGAAGGAAGPLGFLPDAGFTTLVILRSIARIAVAAGEDLTQEDARRACLEVFAVGGPARTAGAAASGTGGGTGGGEEEGYWAARLMLQGAPLVRLISQAAARLGVVLSEKLALQAVPVAGAAGGVLVNTAFLEHYRALAEGHFAIRRLERQHGADAVRLAAQHITGM